MPRKQTIYKKRAVADDVLTLARRRLRLCFDRFDKCVVFFSGGKDSTVCLNLAIDAARDAGRLPLECVFYDEEAIPPETVEYVARVAGLPEVNVRWLCIPVKHRNAASRHSPWWHPWAQEDRPLWCRQLPPQAITSLPGFARQSTPELQGIVNGPSEGRVAAIMGIRTQESLNRYMAIAINKTGPDAFMCGCGSGALHVTRAYPIYDWATEDVWLAPQRFGWDYNRAYDIMAAAGVPPHNQRCAPPFGEQPLERLWTYGVCWPELWAKMCRRVPGAATAARYARTELYGYGNVVTKPDVMSWRDYCLATIDKLPAADRVTAAKGLHKLIDDHRQMTKEPMPEETPHAITGLCWKDLGKLASRGDLKGRVLIGIWQRANARSTTRKTTHAARRRLEAQAKPDAR